MSPSLSPGPQYVRVCRVSDIPDPGKTVVQVGDRLIALFHVAGQFFALDDLCTHDGGPLAEGELRDHTIRCPRHGALFDIRTGQALSMPATQPTGSYEVKVVGDEVFVHTAED